jgi:hypothetical protein
MICASPLLRSRKEARPTPPLASSYGRSLVAREVFLVLGASRGAAGEGRRGRRRGSALPRNKGRGGKSAAREISDEAGPLVAVCPKVEEIVVADR